MSSLTIPIIAPDVTTTSTTSQHVLGAKYTNQSGTTYQYVQAGAALTLGNVYPINPATFVTGTTGITHASMGSGANPNKLGAPQIAFASGAYGWVAIAGTMTISFAGAVAANAKLYTSATAGQLDDASASQTLINGLYAPSAVGAAGNATAYAVHELSANCFA